MIRIGLTGGIAAGKSTVCQLFSALEVPIIDADIIARELVEPQRPAFKEIVTEFGSSVLSNDGSLNRKILRQLIFSNPQAKQRLESILHPKIKQQLIAQSDAVTSDYCIIAIPLLIESHWQNSVDRILVIDVETEQQKVRLSQRDNLSNDEAEKMIVSQCSREQRLAYADDVITNNQDLKYLSLRVQELDRQYRLLANSSSTGCQHDNSQRQ